MGLHLADNLNRRTLSILSDWLSKAEQDQWLATAQGPHFPYQVSASKKPSFKSILHQNLQKVDFGSASPLAEPPS
jgi:hypothetical protein